MCTMTLLVFASFALLMAVDLLSISLIFWKGLSDRMQQATVSHRPNSNHAQSGGYRPVGLASSSPYSKAKQRRQHDIFQSQLEQGGNQ